MNKLKENSLRPYYLWTGLFSKNVFNTDPPILDKIIYNSFPNNINIVNYSYVDSGIYNIEIASGSFNNDLIEISGSILTQVSTGEVEINCSFNNKGFDTFRIEIFDAFNYLYVDYSPKFTITIKQYY